MLAFSNTRRKNSVNYPRLSLSKVGFSNIRKIFTKYINYVKPRIKLHKCKYLFITRFNFFLKLECNMIKCAIELSHQNSSSVAGKSKPKESANTRPLPSPLDVASALQNNPASQHESVTALLGAWSELLLNDLSNTGNLKSQDCCSENARNNEECYGMVGHGQCREYMRTLPAVDMDVCSFGKCKV